MPEDYKKIAISILGEITSSEERKDAFIFFNNKIKYDGCVVILKKSKKILTMAEYIFRS